MDKCPYCGHSPLTVVTRGMYHVDTGIKCLDCGMPIGEHMSINQEPTMAERIAKLELDMEAVKREQEAVKRRLDKAGI